MGIDVDSARRDWVDGYRRFAAASHDPVHGEQLRRQVDVVSDELRRRVGGTYTLAELARVYATSEAWARHAVDERAATPGWARTLSIVGDAAFHIYARGALDYEP